MNCDRLSFRCGIFFAGQKVKDKPSEKLFILPKRFPVNRTLADDDGNILEPKVYTNDVCPINDPYGTDRSYGGSAQNATCFFIVSTSCIKRAYFVGTQFLIAIVIILMIIIILICRFAVSVCYQQNENGAR